MPQMSPMNWTTLFLFFIITFIIFNSINYFTFLYNPKQSTIKKISMKFNWKW